MVRRFTIAGNGKYSVGSEDFFNIGVDEDFEVLRQGLVWKLNPSNFVEQDLYWLGVKDCWELYHSKLFLRSGEVIFDIGANFGYYSCMIASILSKNCKIYAFEPIPSNYERLKKCFTEQVRELH